MAATPEQSVSQFINSLQLTNRQADELTAELLKDPGLVPFLESRDHPDQENESSSSSSSTTGLSAACRVLRTALGAEQFVTAEKLTEPNGTWSATTWQRPACAVLPETAQDVAAALRTVRFFGVRFAVRSGGHSPNPGHSSVPKPGILIDLRRLNDIRVNGPNAKTVTVGPGQRWGDVIAALDPYKVTVIGGRSPSVGVGGLILGGGYFHFSPEFGLAADNVKSFEVVLADGSIVKASSCKHPDLFWALKGGGPNFGIVTSFELYTVPVHEVWVEGLAFSPTQVPDVFEAYAAFQKSTSPDLKATVSVVVSLDVVLVALLYSAPSQSRPRAFAPFENLTPLAVVLPPTNTTILKFSQLSAATQPNYATRHDYRAVSSKIDAKLYTDVYKIWFEQATKVKAATGANQTFTVQTFSKNLVQQGIKRGGNPLGMPLEDFQCWTTLVDWNNAADDAAVRRVGIETTEAWRRLSTERGLGVDYLYMNDASRDQNPLASYGAANIARLRAIAAKYDPARVFQTLQHGGFLLRNV
ncbi:FAD linked oxidase-like protein [Corynascus similis CBS 632.67]